MALFRGNTEKVWPSEIGSGVPNSVLSTNADGRVAWEPSPGTVNVLAFGAVGDGVADDSVAIAAAITAADDAGGRTVVVPGGTYKITTGLVVPNGCSFLMDPEALLVYTGTGVAVTLHGWFYGQASIRVQRSSVGWFAGTDTTSVGVQMLSCFASRLDLQQCDNFAIGLEMRGDTAVGVSSGGTVDCSVSLGLVVNCKRGIVFTAVAGGYANANTFYSGDIQITSAFPGIAGTKYIDATAAGDGNTFFGANLEGSASVCEVDVGSAVVGSGANTWFFNCRWEAAKLVRFNAGCFSCGIVGGYGNPGFFDGTVFVDSNGGNFIVGGDGNSAITLSGLGSCTQNRQDADNANLRPATNLTGLTSNASVIVQAKDQTGHLSFRLFPDGKSYGFTNGSAFAKFGIDHRTGELFTGDGTIAATHIWSIISQTRIDWLKELRIAAGGRITSAVNSISGATPDVSGGNVFLLTQSGATNVTDFTNGITFQRITIDFGDGSSTIKNGATIRTKTGADFTPTTNEVIDFLNIGGVWSELGR